jgi:phospholipase/carboxylesterase
MLHAEGEDEDAVAHLAPRLSPRNYIAACPRGLRPVGNGLTGRPTFSWHAGDTRLTRYLLGVVAHARREYHIHPDRIYLLGIRDGAAVAGRAGAMLAGRIAGVIALNGVLPRRVDRTAGLRVFVGHGSLNPLSPVAAARKAALRWAATGAELRYHTYPATHAITDDMLRDVNRWIIDSISPDDTLSNPID